MRDHGDRLSGRARHGVRHLGGVAEPVLARQVLRRPARAHPLRPLRRGRLRGERARSSASCSPRTTSARSSRRDRGRDAERRADARRPTSATSGSTASSARASSRIREARVLDPEVRPAPRRSPTAAAGRSRASGSSPASNARLRLAFHGSNVFLVLGTEGDRETVEVTLDDEPRRHGAGDSGRPLHPGAHPGREARARPRPPLLAGDRGLRLHVRLDVFARRSSSRVRSSCSLRKRVSSAASESPEGHLELLAERVAPGLELVHVRLGLLVLGDGGAHLELVGVGGALEVREVERRPEQRAQPLGERERGLRAGRERDVVRDRGPEARGGDPGLAAGVVQDADDAGRALVARGREAQLLTSSGSLAEPVTGRGRVCGTSARSAPSVTTSSTPRSLARPDDLAGERPPARVRLDAEEDARRRGSSPGICGVVEDVLGPVDRARDARPRGGRAGGRPGSRRTPRDRRRRSARRSSSGRGSSRRARRPARRRSSP